MAQKEFLKLENRLILKLKIKPISPLLIKLGDGKESEESDSEISFIRTESSKVSQENAVKGEPFIPGSTLKGLFREMFCKIYGVEDDENEKIRKIFGYIDNNKEMFKGRIFLDDAYLLNEDQRRKFYEGNANDIIKTRSITPIDAFTGKAVVPLTLEYIDDDFLTILTVNNITKEELKNIYFIIRDSLNGEIRIGNSKTRGFGQVEFYIEDFIFEKYAINNGEEEYKYIDELREFFEVTEEDSIKIGNVYLRENLSLKEKEVDIYNPSRFIRKLFGEE